jgi:hypothetical protein
MKNLFIFTFAIMLMASCTPTQHAKNHSGIREWKAGKQMPRNRRANERPQCIDSW